MARFKRKAGRVEMRLSAPEAGALERLLDDFLQLLSDDVTARLGGAATTGQTPEPDPLESLVGLSETPVARPTDPAVIRLFPDAYGDDAERASEYRRYMESDLRESKRASAAVVRTVLSRLGGGGKTVLGDEEVPALLGSLNDLRLVLGARLDIQEDYAQQVAALRPGDPRLQAFAVYEALTALQDELLRALLH